MDMLDAGPVACHWLNEPEQCFTPSAIEESCITSIQAYFTRAQPLCLPALQPAATTFQQRLRQCLLAIPPGQTRTYGELAKELGSSARAVAQGCRANPLPLLVPCHRVVARQGRGGYMGQNDGQGMVIKNWLLDHES